MVTYLLPFALQTAALSPAQECAQGSALESERIADVCSEWIDSEQAYSATMHGRAAQQILIFKTSDGWRMLIAGFSYDGETGTTSTRRRELSISDASAETIAAAVNAASIERLGKLEYYGSPDVICMDGSKLEVAMAQSGQRHSADQHSCADQSELHKTMAAFRDIALEYDDSFEGFLTGLKAS